MEMGLGLWVQGLGFRAWALGFKDGSGSLTFRPGIQAASLWGLFDIYRLC